jgi:SAM-dependent methyltransferase
MAEQEYRNKTIDYAQPLSAEDVANRRHRRRIGNKWALMGPMQLDFMVAQGLEPADRLLDVGCGPLRAGLHFVEYLAPGHYYGIDINETLINAGYEHELPARLRERLPRDHLRATDRFDCNFGVNFDFAIAQSVFTHVSLNHIRLCLFRVAQQIAPGGRFFASFFEVPRSHPLDHSLNEGRGWTERNAFFYYRSDLKWAARCADWDVHYIGKWGHPGGQRMIEFRHSKWKASRRALARRAERGMSPRLKRSLNRALKPWI